MPLSNVVAGKEEGSFGAIGLSSLLVYSASLLSVEVCSDLQYIK